MALMAVDMRVGNEVVKMCVVMERRSGRLVRRIVHESSEEPEGFRLAQSAWTNDVGELDFERGCLVRELCDRAIEFEADLFARTWISEDHAEALAARKEGRLPKFRGR